MIKTVVQLAGVAAWGLVLSLGVFYISFPSRPVADRIAYEAQQRGWVVQVERPKPRGLGGVRFRSLEVGPIKPGKDPKPLLSMGRTWVKVRPLKALRGIYDVSFDGKIYEGHAKGDVDYSEDRVVADIALDGLKVSAFPLSGETWNVAGGGSLDGTIDLDIDLQDIVQSKGEISLEFDNLALQEGTSFYGMAFETVFDEAMGRLDIEKGKASVERTRFKSDKIEGEVTGYITLRGDLARSRLALKIKFKLLDEALDQVMAFKYGDNPAHKDDKGYYHYLYSGPVDRARFKEDRSAARRSNRGTTRERTSPAERKDRRSQRLDEMTDEERAEWEAEREKRREELRKRRDERRRQLEEARGAEGRVERKDVEFSDGVRTGTTAGRRDELVRPADEEYDEGEFDDDEPEFDDGGPEFDEGEPEFDGPPPPPPDGDRY